MKDHTEFLPGPAADAAVAGAILALGGLLAANGLVMLDRWRQSSSRMQSPQLEDVLGGMSAVAGILIVAWWIAALLLAVASAGLARTGRGRAAAVVGKAAPAFMRRLAMSALGLQLIAGPAVAHAAPAPEPPGLSAEWAPATELTGDPAYAAPQWEETRQDAVEPDALVQPQWKPTAPPGNPRLLSAPPLRAAPTGTSPPASTQVTVLAGDTLWTIAARALGPQASDLDIALDWPRWYEANRTAIGDNPDVLLPGQILQAPSAA